MLTLNATQANWKIPLDIITGESIILDRKECELFGQKEVIINNTDDFIKFGRLIEKNRTCRTT